MPIIVFGTWNVHTPMPGGEFVCPNCFRPTPYTQTSCQSWVTFFLLPVYPQGEPTASIQCGTCRNRYNAEILKSLTPPAEFTPPVDGSRREQLDPNLGSAYAALLGGNSLGITEARLQECGFSAERAEAAVRSLCDGEPRRCACGRRYHPTVNRCAECESSL